MAKRICKLQKRIAAAVFSFIKLLVILIFVKCTVMNQVRKLLMEIGDFVDRLKSKLCVVS